MNKNVLQKEIELINYIEIKEWTKATLANAPDYFFIAQASSTGKYHPQCTNQKSGLIVHVQRAVYIANRLCTGYGVSGLERDIVLSAMILHDIAKTPNNDPKYTFADFENHPINAEKYWFGTRETIALGIDILAKITNCIKYHMGLWTPASIKKPIKDYTLLELIVYTSDYMASTKDLITPVDNRDNIPCQCEKPLENELSSKCGNCGLEIKIA